MLDMIERLLLEADLEDQLPKLEVIVINIDFNLGKKFLSSTLIYSGDQSLVLLIMDLDKLESRFTGRQSTGSRICCGFSFPSRAQAAPSKDKLLSSSISRRLNTQPSSDSHFRLLFSLSQFVVVDNLTSATPDTNICFSTAVSISITHIGHTLIPQDILKDAKHKLRPWELEKKRKIRGLKRALVPNLGYSQIYCYYRYSTYIATTYFKTNWFLGM